MTTTLYNRLNLGNKNDLTTPTSTQEYPLGYIYEVSDSNTAAIKKYMYVKSHAALTAYVPYLISASGTAGSEVITAAPATLASAVNLIGIPQVDFTSGYYGFVQIEGKTTAALRDAATAGWTVEILNSGASLVGLASTELVGTLGYVIATTTAATNGSVYITGKRVEIRATT